jgi:hypothetical protein
MGYRFGDVFGERERDLDLDLDRDKSSGSGKTFDASHMMTA